MKYSLCASLSLCSIIFLSCNKSEDSPVAVETAVPSGMVLVSGGTFSMGSAIGYADEKPVHAVTVSSFWLDAREVTVTQYRAFCTATGRPMPAPPSWGWAESNPMVNVSWEDASAYCQWAGKRLPTEAEWEFAARGGNLGKGYTYSGSNTLSDVAWYPANAGGRTQGVGTKTMNELGIFDLSGNVWEWCSDVYDEAYYSVSPSADPKGPSSGSYRVIRGGAWNHGDNFHRVAERQGITATTFSVSSGFRCAKDM